MSVGIDGLVYYWNVFTIPIKKPIQYNYSLPFLCGTCTKDFNKSYIVTTDKVIKEFTFNNKSLNDNISINNNNNSNNNSNNNNSNNNNTNNSNISGNENRIQDPKDISINHTINNIICNDIKKLLICATSDINSIGSLITYKILPELSIQPEISNIHAGPITAVCLSYDGNILITGDIYGCLFISEFETINEAMNTQNTQANTLITTNQSNTNTIVTTNDNNNTINTNNIISFEFVDEVLIKKSQLELKKYQLIELNAKVSELTMNNDYQMRTKEMEFNEKIKEITNKFKLQFAMGK